MNIKAFISSLLLFSAVSNYAFANSSTDTETSTSEPITSEAAAEAFSAEEEQYMTWATNLWQSLNPQTGEIKLPNAVATVKVPENFYYLSPQDAEKVLVEVWGNPPGNLTLGMLFPADTTPFDQEAWAVTIQYEEDGYVSDEDADDIDYTDLLEQMQKDTAEGSKQRVEMGYEPIELIGWATTPYYDAASNKMHWAKEIKFGDDPVHTLNYNIRVLGRKGVLVLNFIAGMHQKQLIETNLDDVIAMAEFDQGAKYADFDPDIDQVAAYGLGALVAGKVIAKTGFLAAAILFLKKFGIFIVIGIGALLKKMFSRKSAE
ncbi:DUF2167 domain-containing protein [Litoribacillus peritrichatus]|uniref:DUF2167 domain-containing protein n=1 Tax=Litoribacillus peritrichatus TaxID=718191 RepID=A0ABP7MLX4_9GAMM